MESGLLGLVLNYFKRKGAKEAVIVPFEYCADGGNSCSEAQEELVEEFGFKLA